MKNFKKVTILRAVVLLLMCGLFMAPITVSAAKKKDLKIKYKGKTVTIDKNITDTNAILNATKQAWGEPDEVCNEDKCTKYYYGKKNKSYVLISINPEELNMFEICIKDKKMSANGIKIGAKKAKAINKLKKQFGKKNVKVEKNDDGSNIININKAFVGHYIEKKGKIKKYCYVTFFSK